MWRKSRFKLVENRKNDLVWLLIHRVIRVRYALKSWGYIDNDKCAICNRVETIEHCFLECPRVVKLWNHFSPILSILRDSPSSFLLYLSTTLFLMFSLLPVSFFLTISLLLFSIGHGLPEIVPPSGILF